MRAQFRQENPPSAACELFRRCVGSTRRAARADVSERVHEQGQRDWDEFTRRYEWRLRSALRKTFGPRRTEADVDDCLQDLYLRLLSLESESFRGRTETELCRYLEQMARRLVLDRRRAVRCERRYIGSVQAREDGFHHSTMRPVQERRAIARQRLGGYLEYCRRVLDSSSSSEGGGRLRFLALRLALVEGYSSREIAHRLGGRMSAPQVDSMVHRLRRKLSRDGITIHRRGRRGKLGAARR